MLRNKLGLEFVGGILLVQSGKNRSYVLDDWLEYPDITSYSTRLLELPMDDNTRLSLVVLQIQAVLEKVIVAAFSLGLSTINSYVNIFCHST